MGVGVRHFNNADATPETPVVHRAAKFPIIGVLVEHLDRLQVRRSVEAAHGEELSVHHCEADLQAYQISNSCVKFTKF